MTIRARLLTALVLTVALTPGPTADGSDRAATTPPPFAVPPFPQLAIVGASPRQEATTVAAVGLFTDAGLTLPEVEIHFHDSRTPCNGRNGFHRHQEGSSRVDICMPHDRPDVFQRQLIVHELAHAWQTHTLTGQTRQAFMETRRLDTWDSHDTDWSHRGTEHAAEIITWGIFDRPMPVITLPDTDCDALQTGYQLLTGTTPNRTDDHLCTHWTHHQDTTPARNPAI